MPTPFTHGLVGSSLAQLAPGTIPRWKLTLIFGCLGILTDVDLLAFHFGVRYSDMLGHRGLTHSLLFALVLALVVSAVTCRIFRPRPAAAMALLGLSFLAVLSHGVLDAATNGGLGVGFLLPLADGRYFWPFQPIVVSPLNPLGFLAHSATVLASEILWVWFPILAVTGLVRTTRRLHHHLSSDLGKERAGCQPENR